MPALLDFVRNSCDRLRLRANTGLLVGGSTEELLALNEALVESEWQLCHAENIAAALKVLDTATVPVAICSCDLKNGDWREMLNAMQELPNAPSLIVGATSADNQFWAEVLNLGAYDLLMRPYNAREVAAVLDAAVRSRDRRPQKAMMASS
jgi:DNA-binding response OmpR family regulator